MLMDNDIQPEKETTFYIIGCMEGRNAGKPVLSCSFGSTSYFGLCDLGSSINIIPYSLYAKIFNDISPSAFEKTDIVIKLAWNW